MREIRNGWQVALDMCFEDGENKNIINSPLFETEEQADNWYRTLDWSDNETMPSICDGIDCIMVHYVNDEIEDTYII